MFSSPPRIGRNLAFLALAVSQASMADLYVAVGMTSESTAALRLEVDRTYGLARLHPQLDLRLATGLLLLEGQERDHNGAWLVTPTLRWSFGDSGNVFLEGGIGAAVFLNTRYESSDLGSAFQFQDRIAIGSRLGAGELVLSATHYSNAGIKSPNNGFEVLALGYRWTL